MTGQITIGDDQRMTVVTLPAEMVYRNASCVHDELTAALEPGVAVVVIDLTPTVFCDSAGLGKLVYAHRLATTHATSLRIVIPPLRKQREIAVR